MIFAVWLGWLPFGMNLPAGMTAGGGGHRRAHPASASPGADTRADGRGKHHAAYTGENDCDHGERLCAVCAARGESSGYIVKRHALRNLVLPAITLQFGSISEIFGGSVLVEQVFSYPGLGQAAIDAGLGSDVSLLLAITVISTLFVFLGNLAANVLYGVIDPQIRRGRSHG